MSSRTAMIQWYLDRVGQVTYSSQHRHGPDSYDSASALLNALVAGRFLSSKVVHADMSFILGLEDVLLYPISRFDVQAGDIFVAGLSMFGNLKESTYAGVILDGHEIVSCQERYDGIQQTSRKELPWLGVKYYRLREPVPSLKKLIGIHDNSKVLGQVYCETVTD